MNLFKNVKNLFISLFIRISISLSKLENDLFKNSKDKLYSGDGSEIDNIQNELLKSLRKGEYNKEYVDKFYKILKMSDNILNKDKNSLKEIAKKHGMNSGNEDLRFYLNSKDVNKPSNNYSTDIENIIKNNIEIINPLESLKGENPIKITKIKSKDLNREHKIEDYTEYLYIKKYEDNYKLLEFHLNKYLEIKEMLNDFKKTSNIYFKDKYGELSEFTLIGFITIEQYNTYNVLKFKANAL
jgi:hypothetical protein